MFPEMQEKAYQEVMDILGPERNVQPTDINRLVYLERFIKETLRLFPSSIGLVRKIENDIDLSKCRHLFHHIINTIFIR